VTRGEIAVKGKGHMLTYFLEECIKPQDPFHNPYGTVTRRNVLNHNITDEDEIVNLIRKGPSQSKLEVKCNLDDQDLTAGVPSLSPLSSSGATGTSVGPDKISSTTTGVGTGIGTGTGVASVGAGTGATVSGHNPGRSRGRSWRKLDKHSASHSNLPDNAPLKRTLTHDSSQISNIGGPSISVSGAGSGSASNSGRRRHSSVHKEIKNSLEPTVSKQRRTSTKLHNSVHNSVHGPHLMTESGIRIGVGVSTPGIEENTRRFSRSLNGDEARRLSRSINAPSSHNTSNNS